MKKIPKQDQLLILQSVETHMKPSSAIFNYSLPPSDWISHLRRNLFIYKNASSLIARLYECAQNGNVKYIVGYEQFGISHQTMEPYVFSTNDQNSVWWRGFMYIHNYPSLLKDYGYTINGHAFLETRHSDPDYRMFEWVASRS